MVSPFFSSMDAAGGPERPRPGWRGALALAVCVVAAACQAFPERGTAPPPTAEDAPPPPGSAAMVPPPAPKPPSPPAVARAEGPPRPPRPPVRVGLDLAMLEGLTPEEVSRRLGRPWWRHDEPPARVWTYVAGPCILQLFFYPELQFEERRVLAYDLDPGSDAAGAAAQCRVALHRRAPMSAPTPAVTPVGPEPGPARPGAWDFKVYVDPGGTA